MSDTVLQVRVPSSLLEYGLSQRDIERNLSEWLVLSLFTDGRVSSGKAAQLLNISRLDFLDLLHKRGIAYLDYTPQELDEEFDSVNKLVVNVQE